MVEILIQGTSLTLYNHSTLETEQLHEIFNSNKITLSFMPMISECKLLSTPAHHPQ